MKTITVDVADKSRGVTIRGELRIEGVGVDEDLADAIAAKYREASRQVFALLERRRS